MIRRAGPVCAALALGSLVACTSTSRPQAPARTPLPTVRITGRALAAHPLPAGPTKVAAAAACPLLRQQFVADTVGMRLARITVLRNRGRVTGCRFYALQNSPLHDSEHLPGPHQPAVQVTTWRYRGAASAKAAVAARVELGTAAQRARLGPGTFGACFRTAFYPPDHGADWACAASAGPREVLVQTVDTTSVVDVVTLIKAVLHGR